MSTLLYRLGKFCFTNKWRILAVWLLIIVGLGVVAGKFSKPMSNTFTMDNIPSMKALGKLGKVMGGDSGKDPFEVPTAQIVIKAPNGTKLTDKNNIVLVNKALDQIRQIPDLMEPQKIQNPVLTQDIMAKTLVMMGKKMGKTDEQARQDAAQQLPLSADKTVEYVDVTFAGDDPMAVSDESVDKLKEVATSLQNNGFDAELSGIVIQSKDTDIGGNSELIGVLVAALVLMITFGSFVAWGLPIISALVGVGIGMLLITTSTIFTEVNQTSTTLATMIGLAVGIDYSLFVLSRYRHELNRRKNRAEAIGVAVGTAGSAVVFAGLTVLISLLALSVVRIPFLTQMAFGAAGTVAVAICVAVTLLPALVGLFGSKVFAGKVPFVHPPETDRSMESLGKISNGTRVINFVGKHSPIVFAVVFLGLLAAAIPVKSLNLSLPTAATMDKSNSMRKSYDILSDSFGPGHNSPLMVIMENNSGDKAKFMAGVNDFFGKIKQDSKVDYAYLTGINPAADTALVSVLSKTNESSKDTADLVHKIRDLKTDYTDKGIALEATGEAAIMIDISQKISSALIPYLAIITVLCIFILMLVFRSLWVPISAALGFILTIGATFGLTVGFFQKGWLGLVANTGPIISFLPIMLIGIVFGLAMDYQVFLVTRMREEYVHGASAREAVKVGYQQNIRIVAAAATIMISVFLPFALNSNSIIKQMGFALAAGVFFDAFLVRMVLIPAFMFLMGDKAWYLPKWLDKILPKMDIEVENLVKYLEKNSDNQISGTAAAKA